MNPQDYYDQGFLDGLKAYAHWKDGKQWVGTTGSTLEQAIKEYKETWNYKILKEPPGHERG